MSAACSPNCTNDDLVLIKRIVEMAGQLAEVEPSQSGYACFTVRCSRAWKPRQDTERLFDLGSEEIALEPVLQPPALLAVHVPPSGRGEANASWLQVERRSFRISAASTRRPAATSAPDSCKAAWSAARSSSSSQSPGSSGRSSTSVPSGKSVGSSTTSRPARTRALSVMQWTVTLERSPNKPLERTGADTIYSYRAFASAGRSAPIRWTAAIGRSAKKD
jgi:hypothetical protein